MTPTSRLAARSAADPDFKPPPGPPTSTLGKLAELGRFLLRIDHVGRNIPLFPDDTFLVSFPRSGSTWLRFLMAGLAFPDRPLTFTSVEQMVPDPIDLTRRELARVPRPRIVKSHEYFDPRYPRVIYIVRDPRDVLISYYDFYRKQRYIADGYPMDRWVEHFLAGDPHPFGSWGEHVGSWLAARGRSPDLLLVRYEDLVANTAGELARIAAFLGIEAPAERLARVIELSSAEAMRSLEKRESSGWGGAGKWRNDIPFVGPAVVGRWKSELDHALVARMESVWWPLMSALGYEIVTSPESEPALPLTPAQVRSLVGSGVDLGRRENSYTMSVQSSIRLPDFIGVGPPRTATTWLHENLSGYVGLPEGVKETDFFVFQYSKGLAWYAAHFRHCPRDRPMGEFSPNYFVSPRTRERIARHMPHCQIICTFRDPVERVYSHYRKMCEGSYFQGTFEECLEKRPDVLEWSRYAYHLRAWRCLFGAENVLVLFQDDLKADPQSFLDQACDFLRIPRIPLANSASQSRMINAIPSRPRNPRLARLARITRDHLQKRGNYAVVHLLQRASLRNLLFSGGTAFESIRPETDAHLREIFRPEVEALEEMLGRDLSGWKAVNPTSGGGFV